MYASAPPPIDKSLHEDYMIMNVCLDGKGLHWVMYSVHEGLSLMVVEVVGASRILHDI